MGTRTCVATIAHQMTALIQNVLDASGTATASATPGSNAGATQLESGAGANQANRFYSDKGRTLIEDATETLDLYDFATLDAGAGAAMDALGQSLVMAEIVGFLIEVDSASVGNLLVGGDGTTAAWNSMFNADDTAKLVVVPGGFFMAFAPTDPAYAVADTSNHLLKLEATGGDVTYDIHILGRAT